MSTKNLARTVIEGGRHNRNRWQRRHSHRKHERVALGRVLEVGPALFWCTLTPGLAWRQDRRMDDEDAALWRSLPLEFRERHTPAAPTWRDAR
jgi:hypothetical protein